MRPESRATRYGALVAAVVAVVALAAAAGLYLASRGGAPAADCPSGRTPLRVVAAPDIAPVVSTVAGRLTAETTSCVDVTVTAAAPAAVLTQLQTGSIQPPDVWVPSSTLWLTRAKDDKVATATDAPAIATSPLVLAVSAAEAAALHPNGRPSVADLVASAATATPASVQLATERLAPERVGAILALRDATAGRPDGRGALTALLRSATVADVTTATSARPMSEQAVWAGNTGATASLVAIYASQASYDYPYAVLSTAPATQTAAGRLLDRLTLPSSQQALRSAGFRDAQGGPGFDLTGARGVDGAQTSRASRLDATSLDDAEKTLKAVRLDAKLTTVVDISGSMAWGIDGKGSRRPLPHGHRPGRGAGGAEPLPRHDPGRPVGVLREARRRQALPGRRSHRHPGRRGKQQLLAGISSLQPTGGTGLYTTTLAAVRAAQASWVEGRVNAVVILSDGADSENAQSLDQVVATLKAEAKPDRPVPVITIAFGPDADRAAMAALSTATGGAAYRATSPDQIHQVFLDAVGQRACRPGCAA